MYVRNGLRVLLSAMFGLMIAVLPTAIAAKAIVPASVSITALEKSARNGDVYAMLELSLAYKNGEGVQLNELRSTAWLFFAMQALATDSSMFAKYDMDELMKELKTVRGNSVLLRNAQIRKMNDVSGSVGDARNAQRRSDVNIILNAVYQYAIDNNGALPAGIIEQQKVICATGKTCKGVNLDVLMGAYLVRVPADPLSKAGTSTTNYFMHITTSGRLKVFAPGAENGMTISVER